MRTKLLNKGRRAAVALAALACMGAASAADLLSGLGGVAGYGQLAMLANDDGSSSRLDLPFTINFFGNQFSSFFVNNNGNISFNSPLSTFTPEAFPVANQPMIAPWWADVDTRGALAEGSQPSNAVYVAAPNADTAVVTWHNVGYYSARNDKQNNFQLVLRNRADTGAGNFDIDFRYQQLQWTTGEASGGVDGLGGVPAQAGYDDGTGNNFFTLPGSLSATVLNVVNTSNVQADTPGLWTFAVRNGQTPGGEASNPLMPVIVDGGYSFEFNVVLNQRIFIDPLVAVGYDFAVRDGAPSFQSVLLPNIGDGHFDLFVWDGSQFVASGVLDAGTVYDFGAGGVTAFRIGGIETSAALNPDDTTAFVTGLTFASAGTVLMTQTPITVSVPEPASYALMLLGLVAVGAGARRRAAARG